MRNYLVFGMLALILSACKKDAKLPLSQADYRQTVRAQLRERLRETDLERLDFSKAVWNQVDSVHLYIVRVPFKGSSVGEDFVVVKTGDDGTIQSGKIVHQEGAPTLIWEGGRRRVRWDGMIQLYSFKGELLLSSPIEDGFIRSLHTGEASRTQTQEPGLMPEVIIVSTVHSDMSWSAWIGWQSYFYDLGAGNGNYYCSFFQEPDGGGGITGGYYGGGGTDGGGATMLVDVDRYVDHPAINLNQYLKCFENIPDEGATCSIEIYTDIPVDGDPTKLFDWKTESPGHTFLQLKKSNGSQYALQNIGFYPNSNWKNILDANPVDAKFVDDGGHETNASLKMNLNPYVFKSIVNHMKQIAPNLKYDMDEYNCTDFALDMFNFVRAPLEIPRYAVPGGIGTNATRTPQGLYVKLKQMKDGGDPEAANINIGYQKGFVANSDGPCN